MSRRLLAIAAMLALLAPATVGLPDLLRLLQPAQCFMNCAEDGGPCCCETFGFVAPPVAGHRHGDAAGPVTMVHRPRSDRCTDGCRAVFPARDWNLPKVRIVDHRPPDPAVASSLTRSTSIVLEPAHHSPSRPRAPPRFC